MILTHPVWLIALLFSDDNVSLQADSWHEYAIGTWNCG
ncbi:hypothetical protein L579_4398 [Pantoea sp. AS-PWVM4]|nr:hypothetical protein L579_4398 [Pantoea sp. AS-PWVM4]